MAATVQKNVPQRQSTFYTDDFDDIIDTCNENLQALINLQYKTVEKTQQKESNTHTIKPEVPQKPTLAKSVSNSNGKAALIISELITTEEDYIKKLEYAVGNYEQWLNENVGVQKTRRMFKNLPEILLASQSFLQDLRMNMPNGCGVVAQQFTKNEQLFYKYMTYCRNQQSCETAYKEARDKIREREIALDDKLGLHASLLRPVQRLAKYELLLKELQRLQDAPQPSIADALVLIRDVSQKSDNLINLEHLLKPENFRQKLLHSQQHNKI